MLALTTTLALTGLSLGGLWLARERINGRQRAGEPPLVRGTLPFLGVAPAFGRDAMALLEQTRAARGEVFTLFVAGQRMTFVLDPLSYAEVLKTKQLRFDEIAAEVMDKGFDFHDLGRLACLETLDEVNRAMLKGEHLSPLTGRMELRLRGLIDELGDAQPRSVGLYQLIWDLMFAAGTDAIFGDTARDETSAKAFADFDRQFPLMVAGMPRFMTAAGVAGLTKLGALLSGAGRDASAWMVRRHELLHDALDDHRRGRIQVAVLWAAHANTIPAAFWALAQVLRSPEALAALRAELDAVVGPVGPELPELPVATLDRLVLLDSAVREALRLSSGSLTIRKVTEDCELDTRVGRFALRKGDRVCLAPWLTHHDPEIFEDPARYRFDRFFAAGEVKQFYKRGERVGFALMPFGAGRSMCPGRFFAIAEIKLLVALMLSRFELELEPGAWPQLDLSRVGLGIYPPKTELNVRLRRRG